MARCQRTPFPAATRSPRSSPASARRCAHRAEPRPSATGRATRRFPSRWHASAVAGVTAERPYESLPGTYGRIRGALLVPVKGLLRRFMRWYVEPAVRPAALVQRRDPARRRRADRAGRRRRRRLQAPRDASSRSVLERDEPRGNEDRRLPAAGAFAHGGAEVLARDARRRAPERGHEVDLVSGPVQVVPGRPGAPARRSPGGCSTSRRPMADRSTS